MQHVGANADRGDWASRCDYCNRPCLRSELIRDRQGLLRCDEHDGREPMELDEANAQSAKDIVVTGPNDGGRYTTVSTAGAVSLETYMATISAGGGGTGA
jgi:hypothetical protein